MNASLSSQSASWSSFRVGARTCARCIAVCALFVVVHLVGGVPSMAVAQLDTAGKERASQRIEALEMLLTDWRLSVDAAAIGVDALAFELAFESAPVILDVVRERLVFEPYRGVLRGADGALRAGAGNSFDQALLTATLLGDAGYDVEIVTAELSEEAALRLLAGVVDARPARDVLPPDVERFLFGLADLTGDPEAARSRVHELLQVGTQYEEVSVDSSEHITARLLEAVGAEALRASEQSHMARILDDVRRYAWVRYRLHEAEPWQDAHPAWRDGEPPNDLEVLEVMHDTVPEADLHRVRIEVFVERRIGDTIEVTSVMDAWERPTALVTDRALTLQLAPLDGAALSEALAHPTHDAYVVYDFDPSIIDAAFFTIAIDGAPAPGAVAFDSRGNVVPLLAALDPAAGVVRATGAGAAAAAGALRGIGRSEPGTAEDVLALTGVWYEVTRIEPGGDRRTERRYLIDRLGPEQRSEQRLDSLRPLEHHALLTTVTISIHTGTLSHIAVFDRVLARLEAAQPVLRAFLDAVAAGVPADAEAIAELLERVDDTASSTALEHLLLADSMARAPLPIDRFSYRWAPAVVAIERGFSRVDGIDGSVPYLAVDIHGDSQRVLVRDDAGRVHASSLDAMRVGVWQTVTERAFVIEATDAASSAPVTSAVDAMLSRDPPLLVLRGPEDMTLLPDAFSVDDRAAVAYDLDRGYVIIVHDDPATATTWWRVDIATGETLGLGRGGRGVTERVTVQATSIRIAKYATMAAWYVQCVAIGATARAIAGIDTIPVRTCALPLLGAAASGITATTTAVYVTAMVASFVADVFGFGDIAF